MKALTQVRNHREWSQQRLADESGVNKATINQIERGRRSPNVETLQKLAEALGVGVAHFFPREGASGGSPVSSEPSDEEAEVYGDDYFHGDEPLSAMEFTEYLFRLEGLIRHWDRTFSSYVHSDVSRPVDQAVQRSHMEWDYYRLEETCRAFVRYLAERRGGRAPQRDIRAAPEFGGSFEEATENRSSSEERPSA